MKNMKVKFKREVLKILLDRKAAFINSSYYFIDDIEGRHPESEYVDILGDLKEYIDILAKFFDIEYDEKVYLNAIELNDTVEIYLYSDKMIDSNAVKSTTNHLRYRVIRKWNKSDNPIVEIGKVEKLQFWGYNDEYNIKSILLLVYNTIKGRAIPYARKALKIED